MNRRMLVAAVVVTLGAASTYAADRARNQEIDPLPQTERRFELRALFDRAPGVLAEGPNGITVGPFQVDVLVARIDAEGRLVKVCVDNEEAARRFLQAPIERVTGSRAQEK